MIALLELAAKVEFGHEDRGRELAERKAVHVVLVDILFRRFDIGVARGEAAFFLRALAQGVLEYSREEFLQLLHRIRVKGGCVADFRRVFAEYVLEQIVDRIEENRVVIRLVAVGCGDLVENAIDVRAEVFQLSFPRRIPGAM